MTLADLLGRIVRSRMIVLGLFVAAVIIFPAFKPGDLIAGLGITSVAIGFAFKDVLQNFFAGILILWRARSSSATRSRTLDYEGTVEEINVRSTRLKTYDGERAVLPNGDVYTNAILVRTAYDKRRVRFTVGIGYPDRLRGARDDSPRPRETEGVLRRPRPVGLRRGTRAFVASTSPSISGSSRSRRTCWRSPTAWRPDQTRARRRGDRHAVPAHGRALPRRDGLARRRHRAREVSRAQRRRGGATGAAAATGDARRRERRGRREGARHRISRSWTGGRSGRTC